MSTPISFISRLILILLFLPLAATAQIRAVTTTGEEVILNSDGTWRYVNDSAALAEKVDTSHVAYTRKASASFLVRSTKTNCGVYLDPKKWAFTKSKGDEASEFEFNLRGKDGYAMLITEKIPVPLETLKTIALQNAREAAPDVKLVKQEYRKVNNKIVLFLQMEGTIQGIAFSYLGYYYSSPKGTMQLVTYTATSLVEEYLDELEELLNGLMAGTN